MGQADRVPVYWLPKNDGRRSGSGHPTPGEGGFQGQELGQSCGLCSINVSRLSRFGQRPAGLDGEQVVASLIVRALPSGDR